MHNPAPTGMSILVVEDNPGDVVLLQEAFSDAAIKASLRIAEDGEEALQVLRSNAAGRDGRRPDLIILDLNLPRKNGREVMAEMEFDSALRPIPVAILTSAFHERGIEQEYPLLRCTFAPKTDDFAVLVQTVKQFVGFAALANGQSRSAD